MRRSLTRATAACAAYALVLSLGTAAPAAADKDAPAATDGAAVSQEWSGEPGRTASSSDGGARNPTGSEGTSAADTSPVPARSDGGRTETESSSWTYVDRAFPDRPHDGAETASVGTGRLAWDRVYTRRALFRFPVALEPGTVVDSAVLRAEVAWSYDCAGESFTQLHRVDPFHAGTTWNDQPTARALLDTRTVRGGQAACPVSGGVEFDVTEAYQWAVDNGESHVHLRLGERDESGTAAWRRFDVEDDPPVVVVDHSTPRTPDPTSGSAGLPDDPRHGAAGPGTPGDGVAVHDEDAQNPSQTRSAGGPALSGDTVPGTGGADDVRVRGLDPRGRLRSGGARVRSQRGERIDRPTTPGSHRDQEGDTDHRARGPPTVTPLGNRPRSTDRGETVDRRRPPSPDAQSDRAEERIGGSPWESGTPLPERHGGWAPEAVEEP
ncbi:DNRLRE domain-containing protein [Nocardiopsis sp. CT-R113]|uniref:DNRLRE domain-containing protein n=1 Tax=Nocardiopsis codii TaxID=3065942 RepID=A0ABU7K1R5_9ACTN|nr:DNRLRE domain-containing protein [Nocardiopsis sp. CT-R113]MEE2035789.1 DNRLRE domain-containing protein [Nocardiopsis sp. CT-R113]